VKLGLPDSVSKLYVLRWLAVFTAFWYLQATVGLALIQYLGDVAASLGDQYFKLMRWYEFGAFVAYFAASLLLALLVVWLLPMSRSAELVVVVSGVIWIFGYALAGSKDENALRTIIYLQGLNFTALVGGLIGCSLFRRFKKRDFQ
jgi:hypothetical protein